MIGLEQLERLWISLMKLGPHRLAALGIIGLAVFTITGLAGYFLSRPTMETLYSGLDRDDISAIGSALKDADIPFDVSADGDSSWSIMGGLRRPACCLPKRDCRTARMPAMNYSISLDRSV